MLLDESGYGMKHFDEELMINFFLKLKKDVKKLECLFLRNF
jgi:hypothetical protein